MAKTFQRYVPDQPFLLPPDLRDWLPEGHIAHFIGEVVEELDLTRIESKYLESDARGRPAYHPVMMVKLLIYGYCVGKMSSRKIEQATYDDVAFRVLAGNQHPDHDCIAEFRKRHINELGEIFYQVLSLCRRAGLARIGRVAIDGSKFRANARKYKTMRYRKLADEEQRLKNEIQELLKKAQEIDREEDRLDREGKGEELPKELQRRENRLAKIREAKREIEAEAKKKYEEKVKEVEQRLEERQKKESETGDKRGARPKMPSSEEAVPDHKANRNLTDLDSRIMKDGATKSFQQCYNAQLAVDCDAQIIVAAKITQTANDQKQLVPMLNEIEKNLGEKPKEAIADAGYFSTAAVIDETIAGITLYVPPNQRRPAAIPRIDEKAKTSEQMWHRLMSEEGKRIYRTRGGVVEPVFGQIKHARGFRQFLLRGIEKVSCEWLLICATHNLMKLFRARASEVTA